MAERTAETAVIKERRCRQHHQHIESIVQRRRVKVRIRQRRQPQKPLCSKPAEHQVRQIAKQYPAAVVLIEENIRQIVLVRLFPQPQNMIVDIMVVEIKNHLAHEGRVQNRQIHQHAHAPQRVPDRKPGREKRARQAHRQHADCKHIGVEIHAPPKAIAKAMIELFPLSGRILPRTVYINEHCPKQRANQRCQPKDLEVLLHPRKK